MTDYERTARRSDGGQRQDRGIAYDSEERESRSSSDDQPCLQGKEQAIVILGPTF